jgi:hypothetical protein
MRLGELSDDICNRLDSEITMKITILVAVGLVSFCFVMLFYLQFVPVYPANCVKLMHCHAEEYSDLVWFRIYCTLPSAHFTSLLDRLGLLNVSVAW